MFGWINLIKSNLSLHFFAFRSVIGPENTHHSLNQSDEKFKPITTWLPALSRALGSLVVLFEFSLALKGIFLSSDWPLRLLWFWFMARNQKALSMRKTRRAC